MLKLAIVSSKILAMTAGSNQDVHKRKSDDEIWTVEGRGRREIKVNRRQNLND